MSFESISVRMNRSNSSIPWGLNIGGGDGASLHIASVDKDSLAYKAGLQVQDKITDLLGRDAKTYSLRDAKLAIEREGHDLTMSLQRYLTSHPCLPWTLTEKDNKIVVDHITPTKQSSLQSYKINESKSEFSAHSKSSYEHPAQREDHRPSAHPGRQENPINLPTNLGYQSAPFTNVTNSSFQMRKGFENKYAAESYTKKEKHWTEKAAEAQPSHQFEERKEIEIRKVPVSHEVPTNAQFVSPPKEKYDSSTFAQTYVPVHVNTNLDKQDASYRISNVHNLPQKSPSGRIYHYDQEGNVYYQHSPRTRRQLSPNASIQHLQYNSPMNLYSTETAAEQYLKQTGGLFGTDPHVQKDSGAAYLTSETRRLIAEQESGREMRSHSPSAQSASFKRIAKACGTPVE